MEPIEHEIVIEAPIEVVWRTITEPDLVSTWFARAEGFEPSPGASGTLTFENDDQPPLVERITVVAVERPHRYSYRWCYAPNGVDSMLVTFSLTEEATARTRLRVVETGIEQMPYDDAKRTDYVEQHSAGWREVCGRLAALFPAVSP